MNAVNYCVIIHISTPHSLTLCVRDCLHVKMTAFTRGCPAPTLLATLVVALHRLPAFNHLAVFRPLLPSSSHTALRNRQRLSSNHLRLTCSSPHHIYKHPFQYSTHPPGITRDPRSDKRHGRKVDPRKLWPGFHLSRNDPLYRESRC